MIVSFQCPVCQAEIKRDAPIVPVHMQCPHCNTTVMTPAIGIGIGIIIGGFRIERALGKGSMGEVYLATQLSMQRQVALKIVPPTVTKDEYLVQRFLHESQMLAKVDHPNIVTAFEAGHREGIYFLAMTYVDGEDVSTIVKRDGPLEEDRALSIVLKVAEALSYAWDEHHLLHNDIKPSNIMIDRSGDVKIMDLGLSKTVNEDTGLSMTGHAYGTPNYMSPEQARGLKSLDHRSDQYELGGSLYNMLTGKMPHTGATVVDLIRMKLTEPIPSPRALRKDISRGCEDLLSVMLARDPQDRYATWGMAIEEIKRVKAGRMPKKRFMETYDSPSGSSVHRLCDMLLPEPHVLKKPKKTWGAFVAVALLCALLGTWFFVVSPTDEDDSKESAAASEAEESEALQVFYEQFALDLTAGEEPPSVSEDSVQGVLAKLQQENPEQTDFHAFFRVEGAFVTMDLSGNESLRDVSALAELPIKELRLHGTDVRDLTPLKYLPLEKLGLNDTPVTDLRPIVGAPLKELSLWRCEQIVDITPLQDVKTLERLLLPQHITDIDFLRELTSLAHLTTRPDGWTRTAAEFWEDRETRIR